MSETFHSRVYTDRPPYADFDAPAKFQAIESIIAKRLRIITTTARKFSIWHWKRLWTGFPPREYLS